MVCSAYVPTTIHDSVGELIDGIDRAIAPHYGRGIRAPTNPWRGLGWRDMGVMILGIVGRGALSAPAISKQGLPTFAGDFRRRFD